MAPLAEKKNIAALCVILAGGAAAGFINGFLGAGGGIILMYLFAWANHDKSDGARRDNFATVVAGVLPLCVVSAISYSSRGTADISLLSRYIIPAAVGGVAGAYITDRINTFWLKNIFAVVMAVAGINMVFR